MDDSLFTRGKVWTLVQQGQVQLIDLHGRDEAGLPRMAEARAVPLEELPMLDRERPIVFVSATAGLPGEARVSGRRKPGGLRHAWSCSRAQAPTGGPTIMSKEPKRMRAAPAGGGCAAAGQAGRLCLRGNGPPWRGVDVTHGCDCPHDHHVGHEQREWGQRAGNDCEHT